MNTPSSPDNMHRLRLDFAFDGTRYSGWQAQDNACSIQGVIEKRLNFIFKSAERLQGASRTDSGVHALQMSTHIDVSNSVKITPERIKLALNRMLPLDIRTLDVKVVSNDFHARFSPIGKLYCYVFDISKNPSPFTANYSCLERRKLNIESMQKALKYCEGTHDFLALSCQGSTPLASTIRQMFTTELVVDEHFILCSIAGNGFLYKMVRSIMGVVRDIGIGLYSPEMMLELLQGTPRTAIAQTAPAQALFLCKNYYQTPHNWKNEIMTQRPFAFF